MRIRNRKNKWNSKKLTEGIGNKKIGQSKELERNLNVMEIKGGFWGRLNNNSEEIKLKKNKKKDKWNREIRNRNKKDWKIKNRGNRT